MRDTLLIKPVHPDEVGMRNIFFQIDHMNEDIDRLMDLMNRPDSPYAGRCLFQYNGVRMRLEAGEIPVVLAYLVRSNIAVYGVYEPYF